MAKLLDYLTLENILKASNIFFKCLQFVFVNLPNIMLHLFLAFATKWIMMYALCTRGIFAPNKLGMVTFSSFDTILAETDIILQFYSDTDVNQMLYLVVTLIVFLLVIKITSFSNQKEVIFFPNMMQWLVSVLIFTAVLTLTDIGLWKLAIKKDTSFLQTATTFEYLGFLIITYLFGFKSIKI